MSASPCAEPLLYYQNNVGGSAALLRAIVEHGRLPVVFSSTCATYGMPQRLPIAEDHPQRPINPYGFSKLVVERMLADLDRAAWPAVGGAALFQRRRRRS